MTTYNLADLFESITDATSPDRVAVAVGGGRRLTYRQLDERANRLANHLAAAGVGAGDHVGLQLLNGTEYLEGMLAAFKLRAVPVNINYRYVEKELAYLYDDADLVALVYHRRFAPRVAAVAPETDTLRHLVCVDETEPAGAADPEAGDRLAEPVPGSFDYEEALAAASPERDFGPRSSDDIYIAYTGGTTGMPKGVMWRHEDIFFGAMGGGDMLQIGDPVTSPDELVARLPEMGLATLTTPPLMHVSAHWGAFMSFFGGGKVVLVEHGRFDPPTIWQLVGDEGVNVLVIVGDAMAGPLAEAFDPERHDPSQLIVIGSGGAVLSPANKARLTAIKDGLMVVDGMGSSELGTVGKKAATAADAGGRSRFEVNVDTQVLDDDLRPIEPGSGAIGQLARKGHIPLGYYGDPEKTATTFVVDAAGNRWALAGDLATVEDDGTVVLLGRGSVSINTGGEKVFPEEVEVAVRDHPDVADVLVVGVPDERWGQKVVAVVQPRPGRTLDTAELEEVCRTSLAGYKVPRAFCQVERVVRSPAGKADYRWAQEEAARILAVVAADG